CHLCDRGGKCLLVSPRRWTAISEKRSCMLPTRSRSHCCLRASISKQSNGPTFLRRCFPFRLVRARCAQHTDKTDGCAQSHYRASTTLPTSRLAGTTRVSRPSFFPHMARCSGSLQTECAWLALGLSPASRPGLGVLRHFWRSLKDAKRRCAVSAFRVEWCHCMDVLLE